MKFGLAMLWRPLCVGVLMLMNYPSQNVQAQPTCWNCSSCSDGESCCPSGTKYQVCSKGEGGSCYTEKGACSGSS
jgi:hypothetical protein